MAAATGENNTLTLYGIKHTVLFAFNENLVASSNSLLTIWKSFLYFYENKKGLYRQQTLLGLNILSLYEDHYQKLGTTKILKLSPEELRMK